jgi:hypothetical protein
MLVMVLAQAVFKQAVAVVREVCVLSHSVTQLELMQLSLVLEDPHTRMPLQPVQAEATLLLLVIHPQAVVLEEAKH